MTGVQTCALPIFFFPPVNLASVLLLLAITFTHTRRPPLSTTHAPTTTRPPTALLLPSRNHGGVDRAFLYFDVKADLTTVFNWNVKQLFLFVVCEYETRTNTLNQVVIWDKIVTEEENAKFDLTGVPNKYYLTDHADELRYDLQVTAVTHTLGLFVGGPCRVPPPCAAPLATIPRLFFPLPVSLDAPPAHCGCE